MNETKKKEDEVSMKSSRIFSRMVSKVGYINQKRYLENLRSRVEQRKTRDTYLTVTMLDKLPVMLIHSRRSPSTGEPSVRTKDMFAI